jgi:GAF domain-containing protein
MIDDAQTRDPFKPFLDVAAALLSSPMLDEALQNVARAIGEAMNVATVDIQSYHPEEHCLIEEAAWDREGLSDADRAYMGTRIDLSQRPSFIPILERGEALEMHIDDPDLPPEERAVFEEWGYKTTFDAPLTIGGKVIGVLGVTETRFVRRFMSMERERFDKLCGMAAAAMHNAQLMARQQIESRRLDLLLEVSRLLAAGRPAQEACDAAARGCLEVLGATSAGVFKVAETNEVATLGTTLATAMAAGPAAVDPAAIAAGLAGRALQTGGAVSAAGPDTDPSNPGGPSSAAGAPAGDGTRVAAAATREGAETVLLCAGWPQAHALSNGELKLIEALSVQLALALDNARLAVF